MLLRARIVALAAVFLLFASPAHAANGIWSSTVRLPNYTYAVSLITGPDGNLWFSDFYALAGGTGYIVRLDATGNTTYFEMPNFSSFEGPLPTLALGLTNVPPPQSGSPRQLAFNWVAYNPITQAGIESGLGTIDVDYPPRVKEYAGQNPGDPLYSARLTLESLAFHIASRSSPPEILSYAHTRPSSSTSNELIVGVPFPFTRNAPLTVFPIPSRTANDFSLLDPIITGADANTWYLGSNAIGQISNAGSREFPLPNQPYALTESSTNLWASALVQQDFPPFGVIKVGYTGSPQALYPAPYQSFDYEMTAATSDAVWSLSYNDSIPAVYFMRMSPSGQWSAYPVASPLGAGLVSLFTTLTATADGTLWAGVANPFYAPGTSRLISFRSNRVLSAQPLQLGLSAGRSAGVVVRETNYPSFAFTSSVAASCPLVVAPGSLPGSFVITATANSGYNCGVTFTDRDGISVWVPVTLPVQLGSKRQTSPAIQRLQIFGRS
jgi:hypothetical protein